MASRVAPRVAPLLALALIVAACAGAPSATPGQVNRPITTTEPAWWPTDMRLAPREPDIAWRWLNESDFKCSYSGSTCWGILAVSRTGCPNSLYFELSIEDAAGTAIGYTNDVAGAVQPMQQAKLTFDTFDKAADKAGVSKVSCY